MGAAHDDHDDLAAPPGARPETEPGTRPGTRPGTEPRTDPDAEAREPVPFDLGDGDVATRIAHARQRHGLAGGMLAAGMLGIDQVVNGRKPREDAPIVIAANSDPIDIDRDGISVPLDPDDPDGQFAVAAPPLPRTEPITAPRGGARRRWR